MGGAATGSATPVRLVTCAKAARWRRLAWSSSALLLVATSLASESADSRRRTSAAVAAYSAWECSRCDAA
eukprot:11888751-Alexandrium_andersonii.AAC.1